MPTVQLTWQEAELFVDLLNRLDADQIDEFCLDIPEHEIDLDALWRKLEDAVEGPPNPKYVPPSPTRFRDLVQAVRTGKTT